MKILKRFLHSKTLYGLLTILCLWQVLSLIIASNIVPPPFETIKMFISLLPTTLYKHILVSSYRIFVAIIISLLIGIPLGLLCALSPLWDRLISPITYILYPLPKVAFLPIFMIFLGIGNASKITLMISVIIFQVILAARDGVKEIPKELFYAMASLNLNRLQLIKHLIFPAMLPKIFSAIRISLGISIATLFFAENFATTYGLGYLVMNAWSMVEYTKMFVGIMALSLLGVIFFKAIDLLENYCCPWNKTL